MTGSLSYRRLNSRAFLVDADGITIGTVWRGCGICWAGSRYANDIERTGSSRKAVAEALAAMPRLYDRTLQPGERAR